MLSALESDLIVASATPPGQGGVGIVRLSGVGSLPVAQTLSGKKLQPRQAHFCSFTCPQSQELIDQGVVLWFAAPGSFTGEEVVELQCHGSPVVQQRLIDSACFLGARLARPGEFTERAFLNGKMDLAQAEAVADLIASASVQAARAAVRSMQGEFSRLVNELCEQLVALRIYVEACIDFPDEEVEFLETGEISKRAKSIEARLSSLLLQSQQGQKLNEGINIAIIGQPNAGKSSLLNALSGEDAAIVTDIPGTTRDLLRVDLVLDGLAVRLVDTAGLRETQDQIEQIGVDRARRQAQSADLLLLVVDASLGSKESDQSASQLIADLTLDVSRVLVVQNKIDLLRDDQSAEHKPGEQCQVSSLTGDGIAGLREEILAKVGATPNQTPFSARARHVAALQEAKTLLQNALAHLAAGEGVEIAAEEFWSAHTALGQIVGTMTPDDLLGRIFNDFCIGK